MSEKGHIKICIDFAMAVLLLFLMSYPLTRGLFRHGLCGLILFALFFVHHLLNRQYYRALLKGHWPSRRIVLAGIDMILLLLTLLTLASSLLLFGDVFAFAPFPMTWWARNLHNCVTAWLYIFIAIHLGLHWSWLKSLTHKALGKLYKPLFFAGLLVGLILFFQSSLFSNMFMLNMYRELPEGLIVFFSQYLLIAFAFYLLPGLPSLWKNK